MANYRIEVRKTELDSYFLRVHNGKSYLDFSVLPHSTITNFLVTLNVNGAVKHRCCGLVELPNLNPNTDEEKALFIHRLTVPMVDELKETSPAPLHAVVVNSYRHLQRLSGPKVNFVKPMAKFYDLIINNLN